MAEATEPEIKYDFGGVMVTFTGEVPVSDDVSNTGNTSEKTSEKIREKTGEKTGEKIIKIISINSEITTTELSTLIGISRKGIEWHLTKMKKDHLIRRIGSDKGGYWEVIVDNNDSSTIKEKIREKTGEKTGEKIIKLININAEITTTELATLIGISRKGIEWHLTKMKKDHLIRRIGSDKGGYWEVIIDKSK